MKTKHVIIAGIVLLIGIGIDKLFFPNYNNEVKNSSNTENTNEYHTCPHCSGDGKRINQVSGEYRTCASCGGLGKVTKEQYDKLSK